MKTKTFHDFGTRRGVALLVSLGFIVLLTILIVSYLLSMQQDRLSTQNYSQAIRAQETALGALQVITEDLRMEMNAGSLADGTPTGASYTSGGKRVYMPASASTSQPARIGFLATDYANDVSTTKLPPSLVRVSRAADAFYTSPPTGYTSTLLPPNRASAASSGDRSSNGRRITPARWNKPLLMGTTVPTAFSSKPPDWVYVSRNGAKVYAPGNVATMIPSADLTKVDQVLGRYAYVIYDQGGLLDVNAAGYPNTLPATSDGPAAIRGKSAAAYADIMQLPGMSGRDTQWNTFLSWRSSGSFISATYGNGNFVQMVTKLLPGGFMKFQAGDNPMMGRQDLIDYFKNKIGTTSPVPYLGTFSRTLDAPSWTPTTPSGSTVNYASLAETASSANRNLANVRFSSSGTVSHYKDDGTELTYNVTAGEPLLQSRFSLAKLALLSKGNPDTGAGPSIAEGNAIKACFGLVWDYPAGNGGTYSANGGNRCWNYVGPGGGIGTLPGTIKTLDQVASEKREPDFFELLKASILSGSLGKGPGTAAFSNGVDGAIFYDGGSKFDTHNTSVAQRIGVGGLYAHSIDYPAGTVKSPARVNDMQIIQIGANIIDQYDADSYPTAIYFKYQGVGTFDPAGALGNPLLGPVTMAYGDENLPYLSKIMQLNCSPLRTGSSNQGTASDNATGVMAGWRQAEVWNPHQKPPSSVTPVGLPQKFQIRAYGSAQTYWIGNPRDGNPVDSSLNPANHWGNNNINRLAAGIPRYPNSWSPGLFDPDDIPGSPGRDGWRKSGLSTIVNYFGTGADANKSAAVSDVGTINVTDTNTFSAFYDRPYALTSDTMPAGVTVTSPANVAAVPPSANNVALNTYPHWTSVGDTTYNNYTNHFVAFGTGETTKKTPDLIDSFQPFHVFGSTFCNVGSNAVDTTGLGPANSYAMGWLDSSNRFHPYSFITGAYTYSYGVLTLDNTANDTRVGSVVREKGSYCLWGLADPRTARFSLFFNYFSATPYPNNSVYPRSGVNWGSNLNPSDPGFTNAASPYQRDWLVNAANRGPSFSPLLNSSYYADPDGIVRPGDGIYSNPTTGDGAPIFTSNAAPTGGNYAANDSGGNSQHGRRPVILNRPFQSVGELGYVFRDQPFKTLDFFTQYSADAALLDVFSIVDRTTVSNGKLIAVTSGQLNPNTATPTVVKAILQGAAKKDADTNYNLNNEVTALTTNIAAKINATAAPIKNIGDLVTVLGGDTTGSGAIRNSFTNSPDKGNKAYLEAPLRALSGVSTTRTWNLLIDVVAQSGRMTPRATTLDQFVVEGERRYWLHVALDRYTGEIIDQQLEPVYE